MYKNLNVVCAQKSKTGFDKSAEILTQEISGRLHQHERRLSADTPKQL